MRSLAGNLPVPYGFLTKGMLGEPPIDPFD